MLFVNGVKVHGPNPVTKQGQWTWNQQITHEPGELTAVPCQVDGPLQYCRVLPP